MTAVFLGCTTSKAPVTISGSGNNPYYICKNADQHLENDDITQAEELYKRALGVDGNYAPALIGLSKVSARLQETEKALEYCREAVKSSKNPADTRSALTQKITIYYTLKPKNWFNSAINVWEEIKDKKCNQPEAAALIMGKAYLSIDNPLAATLYFRQVLDWNGALTGEADRLLNGVYQQLRVEPGTHAGKNIILQDRVARSDLAALLVEELKITDYIAANTRNTGQAGFKTPEEFAATGKPHAFAQDIAGHPYENDIKAVLKYEFRGLIPFPGNLFRPDDPMSRAGFCLVLEDILCRLKHAPGTKTENYSDGSTLFSDVGSDHYAFNAIVLCTTRSFVAADLDGRFRPAEPVTGIEALLAVRRLKQEIKKHQVDY